MKGSSILVALSLSFTLAAPSFAAENGPCKDDVAKFCSGVEKGEGRIRACLKENADKLSSDCKEHLEERGERRAKIKEFGEACREDKQKFCGDVKPGAGRIIDCLTDHSSEISSSCKEKIPARGGK